MWGSSSSSLSSALWAADMDKPWIPSPHSFSPLQHNTGKINSLAPGRGGTNFNSLPPGRCGSDLNSLAPGRCYSNYKNITFNSLVPGRFQFNVRYVIFMLTLVNGGWGISYEIVFRWMPLDLTDDKSTLVQVKTWCRQATSHHLSQCWPRSMSPNGVTRPQWIKHFLVNDI